MSGEALSVRVMKDRRSINPQPSPHSALASKPLNSQAYETALAKAVMSGTSRCSGMLGISS